MLTTTMTVLLLWSMILWLGFVVLRANEPVRRELSEQELESLEHAFRVRGTARRGPSNSVRMR